MLTLLLPFLNHEWRFLDSYERYSSSKVAVLKLASMQLNLLKGVPQVLQGFKCILSMPYILQRTKVLVFEEGRVFYNVN